MNSTLTREEHADALAVVRERLGSEPWEKINRIDRELARLPQQEMPLHHAFTPGLYQRSIFIPAGTLLTSRVHLTEHPFVISTGIISVWENDTGWETYQGVHMGITKPGTRRVLFAHTDTIWTTTHHNPENKRDPNELVADLTFDHRLVLDDLPVPNHGEEWRPVVGYEGLYEVSSQGRVKSLRFHGGDEPQIMKPCGRPYLRVNLCRGPSTRRHSVHVLVARAFFGQRPDGDHVNHKSGLKTDNSIGNLEYCTPSENRKHAFRIGLQSLRGSRHNNAKLDEDTVVTIRRRVANGEKQSVIADELGLSPSTVCTIVAGRAWQHVPMEGAA